MSDQDDAKNLDPATAVIAGEQKKVEQRFECLTGQELADRAVAAVQRSAVERLARLLSAADFAALGNTFLQARYLLAHIPELEDILRQAKETT